MAEDIRVHWPQSPQNPHPRPFEEVLLEEIKNADDIDIITGYVGLSSATKFGPHLVACARKGGRVRIMVGMAGVEGLSETSRDAWSSVHQELQAIDEESGVVAHTCKIHTKLYMFSTDYDEKMYIGSQNFNFSSGYMELMVETPYLPEVEEHVNSLFSDSKNILPITGVHLKGTNADPLVRKVSSAEIFSHEVQFDRQTLPLVESIDLRVISNKNPIGSLNLYHGKGRLNSTTGVYIPRPWYEVELTLGKRNHLGLPRDFRAFTDDGKIIEMQRRSGGPTGQPELGLKDLTSKGNRQVFGEWIKGKLERAGALEIGDVIDDSTFDAYGTDQLMFYGISDTEFLMAFTPNEK